MGNIANYIIIKDRQIEIHYSHWRSVNIAHDLRLGPQILIKFIKQLEIREAITNSPWLEGCVLIDMDSQELIFWESEILHQFSFRERYLDHLRSIWKDWSVTFTEYGMLDIELRIGMDYSSLQDHNVTKYRLNDLKQDVEKDYISCLVILKKNDEYTVKHLYSIYEEELIHLGEEIIDILIAKPNEIIRNESEIDLWGIVFIDCDNRRLIVNSDTSHLISAELSNLWIGWRIDIGNFGYLKLLIKSGMDFSDYVMPDKEIEKQLDSILKQKDDFDPNIFAEELLKVDNNAKFHRSYFENPKPKKSFWDMFKSYLNKNNIMVL